MVLIFWYCTYIIILQACMAEVPFWALHSYWTWRETSAHTQTWLEIGYNCITREISPDYDFYLQRFFCG